MSLSIYTYGLSTGGFGGIALVVVKNNQPIKETVQYIGRAKDSTLQLSAVIRAYNELRSNDIATIYTDSSYIRDCNVNDENSELWDQLGQLQEKFPNVRVEWIKPHAQNCWTTRAAYMARMSRYSCVM